MVSSAAVVLASAGRSVLDEGSGVEIWSVGAGDSDPESSAGEDAEGTVEEVEAVESEPVDPPVAGADAPPPV